MSAFTPINSNNTFAHVRMQNPSIIATEAESRLADSEYHDSDFDKTGIVNLHAFLIVYKNQITRTCLNFNAFIPTLEHLIYIIDILREKEYVSLSTTE